MVIALLILLSMFLVPFQSYKLIQLLSQPSKFRGHKINRNSNKEKILIIGDHLTYLQITSVFRDLFGAEEGLLNVNVIILSPSEPNEEISYLLFHPFYKKRISYLIGSPLRPDDLIPIPLATIKACFILQDPTAPTNDSRNLIPQFFKTKFTLNLLQKKKG